MNALAIDSKPLSPVYADEARKPLFILFSAYPEPWADKSAQQAQQLQDARLNAYLLGLSDIPGWAIEKAVREYISGRVERSAGKRGKLPTVEEIASESRLYVREEALRQSDAHRRRQQQQEARREDISPQERARMRLKMPLFTEAMKRTGGIDRLAAVKNNLEELVALAQTWGVDVPEEVFQQLKS